MLFESVRLKNLFSYYGETFFDLSLNDADVRNIVIISGRNGYGKTSFINSLKLLFLGPEDLRSTVLTDSQLSVQQYLLGLGTDWRGALNRVARTERNQNDYFVELKWREDAGVVTVRRSWQIADNKALEELRVDADFAKVVAGEEAQDFLNRRLPPHVLPYFIYDAEQVQRLAEANRQSQMQQIEKLLDLAAVDALDEYLDRNIVEWRRQGLGPEEKNRLELLSAELSVLLAEQEKAELKKREYLEQISTCQHESDKLTRYLDGMRAFALQRDEADIKVRHGELRSQLEQKCNRLFEETTKDAPLLANYELVEAAYETARKGASDPAILLSQEIKGIFTKLPRQLLEEPPHPTPILTQSQRDFLRNKLERLGYLLLLGADSSEVLAFSLPPKAAEALLSKLSYFREARAQRIRIAADLQEVSQIKRQMAELQSRLDDISHLAENERAGYRERREQLDQLEKRRDDLNREVGKVDVELSHRKGEIEGKRREIREQESKVREGEELSLRVTLARRLQTTFREYRQGLKDRRRKQIEDALNARFQELMSSHKLIAKITVGETFALEYLDNQDRPIGLANISAGMKQLVAQALLWALKDVAGRTAPLVIDTPLARIDRRNQDNLIEKYYPKAGRQVIILPTDSEVDERKYKLLRPHVYKEYRLENPLGDRSTVVEGPMYPLQTVNG